MSYNDWDKFKLEQILQLYNGKAKSNVLGQIPIFGGNGILGYTNDYNFENENIIIGRVGAYCGNVHYFYGKVWVSDNAINVKNIEGVSNGKFLYYLLKNINLHDQRIGSSQPLITQSIIKNNIVKIPKLKEQERIAKILFDLDKKIELNNKINDNLEELAQTLYKHWFVDFEFPNEEGLPYKSSSGKMVESEHGLIPEGWNKIKLDEYLEFERGVEPGSKNYKDTKSKNSLAFIRVGDLNKYKPVYVDKEHLKNKYINLDDILVSFDGAIGRVSIGLEGSYSTGLRKIYSNNKINLPKEYIYYLFKSEKIQNTINNHANGTTILHASSSIKFLETVYNETIVEKFSKTVEPIFSKIIQIISENNKLEKLRDLLLPKLMSGEIRVPTKE